MNKNVSIHATEFDKHYIQNLLNLEYSDTSSGRSEKYQRLLNQIIAFELTPKQKQILYLYYHEGLKQKEISERLQIHQCNVSRNLATIRKQLKEFTKYST